MSDKTLEMTMLFDFFGDLLTEKQREYFDLYYNDDLSLSEIAEMSGISRQGVRDNLLRAEAALREMEEKTGVVRRFGELQKTVAALEADVSVLVNKSTGEARVLAERVLTELRGLKG